MNNTEYLKKMKALSVDLERAGQARPYDPDAYNSIIDEMNELFIPHGKRRRRRPWSAIAFCIFLLIVLLLIVWQVLSVLYTKGIQ